MSDVFNIPTVVQFVIAHVEKRQSVIKKKKPHFIYMKHCIVIITHNHRFAYRNEQRHYTSEQAATVWALSETARFGSFHPVHEDIKGAHTGFLFNKLQSK